MFSGGIKREHWLETVNGFTERFCILLGWQENSTRVIVPPENCPSDNYFPDNCPQTVPIYGNCSRTKLLPTQFPPRITVFGKLLCTKVYLWMYFLSCLICFHLFSNTSTILGGYILILIRSFSSIHFHGRVCQIHPKGELQHSLLVILSVIFDKIFILSYYKIFWIHFMWLLLISGYICDGVQFW